MTNYKNLVLSAHDARKYMEIMAKNAKKNGLIIEYCIARHIDGYTSMTGEITKTGVKNIAYDMVQILDPETLEKLGEVLDDDKT